MTGRARFHKIQMAAGVVILIGALQAIGSSRAFGPLLPTPSSVAAEFFHPQTRTLLASNTRVSGTEMLQGLAAGTLTGALLAVLGRMLSPLDESFHHFAVIVQAIPIVAVAPILITIVPRGLIPALLASIGSFFTGFMSFAAGLRAVTPGHDDLFRVLGAGKMRHLVSLGIPAALPLAINGISFAIPGAVVGAVIGEWFGASQGLGIVLLQTMRAGDSQTLLAASAIILAITLSGYGVAFALGRWAHRRLQ